MGYVWHKCIAVQCSSV